MENENKNKLTFEELQTKFLELEKQNKENAENLKTAQQEIISKNNEIKKLQEENFKKFLNSSMTMQPEKQESKEETFDEKLAKLLKDIE